MPPGAATVSKWPLLIQIWPKKCTKKNQGVHIAKLDATVEAEVAEDYEVTSFPTLKLFMFGEPVDYTFQREQKQMEDWIQRQLIFRVPEIESVPELQGLSKARLAVLLVCSKKNQLLIRRFTAVASNNPQTSFSITYLDEARSMFGLDDSIGMVVFRDFEDGMKVLNLEADAKGSEMREFFYGYRDPAVMLWELGKQEIVNKNQPMVFLFMDKKNDILREAFNELAIERRGDILFVQSDLSTAAGKEMAANVGVFPGFGDQIRIVKIKGEEVNKFKADVQNKKDLSRFIDQFKAGKVKQYNKSQPAPKSDRNHVKTVVADNFEDIVLKSNKHVLLKVYAPWCGHCKTLAPKFKKLAQKLSKYPEIVMAKIDATANEIPSLKITGYPTLILYKMREKKKPIEFKGAPNVPQIVRFLEKEMDRDLLFPSDMDDDEL